MKTLRICLLASLIFVVLGSGNSEGEIIDTSDKSFNVVRNSLNICYDENTTCEIIDVIMSKNGKYALALDDEIEFTAINLENMSIIFDIEWAYAKEYGIRSTEGSKLANYNMLFSSEGNTALLSFRVSDEDWDVIYIDFNDGNYSSIDQNSGYSISKCLGFSEISKVAYCHHNLYYFGNGYVETVNSATSGYAPLVYFWNNGTNIGIGSKIYEFSVSSENNESTFSLNEVASFPCSPFSQFDNFFEIHKYVFCQSSENFTLLNFDGEEIGTISSEDYYLFYVLFDEDELTTITSHHQQGLRAKVYNITDLSFISETFISDGEDWDGHIEGRFHYKHYIPNYSGSQATGKFCVYDVRCLYYTNSSFSSWGIEEIEIFYSSVGGQPDWGLLDGQSGIEHRTSQLDNYYPVISEKGIYYQGGGSIHFMTLEPIVEEENDKEVSEDESSLSSVSMIPALISIGLIAIYRRK